MKLGQPERSDAERLYELFADEIANASTMQLMGLVNAFQTDPDWSAAPAWARAAFKRIAEGMRE